MENNYQETKKVTKFKEYYHKILKYRLYAIIAFILGAFSMKVSLMAALLVFIAMFFVPVIIHEKK